METHAETKGNNKINRKIGKILLRANCERDSDMNERTNETVPMYGTESESQEFERSSSLRSRDRMTECCITNVNCQVEHPSARAT